MVVQSLPVPAGNGQMDKLIYDLANSLEVLQRPKRSRPRLQGRRGGRRENVQYGEILCWLPSLLAPDLWIAYFVNAFIARLQVAIPYGLDAPTVAHHLHLHLGQDQQHEREGGLGKSLSQKFLNEIIGFSGQSIVYFIARYLNPSIDFHS